MSHEEHDNQAEEQIRRIVQEYGWYVALFEADTATPAFAYTIGLWKNYGHPEIMIFGLSVQTMGEIINLAGEKVKSGKSLLLDSDDWDILEKSPVRFLEIHPDNISDWFGYCQWFNDYKEFPALQLFWPDNSGTFPWESTYDQTLKFSQPLLDRKLDFKFFEKRNLAVFIVKQIFKDNKPILYVSHDSEEGDWQFLTGDTVMTDDIMIVSLEEVVKHDPTINELFNLPRGHSATRDIPGGKWLRQNEVE
jgi:hypothetical protein